MILRALVVADPVGNVAELVTTQCRRLAQARHVATHGDHLLRLAAELRPELIILSLELTRPPVETLLPRLVTQLPEMLLIGTFRELTVPQMEQLGRSGIDDFVAHPIDATDIFRAVSRRFHVPFRQHPRFETVLPLHRADGIPLGRVVNISEGGAGMELRHALRVGESILVEVALPDGHPRPLRVRLRILAAQEHAPGQVTTRGAFEGVRGEEQRRLVAYIATLDTAEDLAAHS